MARWVHIAAPTLMALSIVGGLGGCTPNPANSRTGLDTARVQEHRDRIATLRLQRDTIIRQSGLMALDEANDPVLHRLRALGAGDAPATRDAIQERDQLEKRAVDLVIVRARVADLNREIEHVQDSLSDQN
ncbi:MAG: hypothetical protein HBSAPP03_01290 [Phycisphaerae bacterium]|nr:MAG: hypothetical protein HBSAPP03_01290 [Phycisphaerae bacterium]